MHAKGKDEELIFPTLHSQQHSNTSEARSTSEGALGRSTGGKVNRCSHLPAHLDGIRATGHGEGAAHRAHATHTFCATATIAHRDALFTRWKDLKVHIISEYK